MTSNLVDYEESYLYEGDIAECKGGGGGSSGKVDYPAYMKTVHEDWLHHTADTMTYSVVDLMNTAMSGNSPYSGFVAVNPNQAFFAATKSLADYLTPYEYLKCFNQWNIDTAFTSYMQVDGTYIDASIAALSVDLDDEVNTKILPRFQSGMVGINAVMSSAFVIGTAIIWDTKAKQVAKADADIRLNRLQAGADIALRRMSALIEWRRIVTGLSGEFARLYIAARTETDDATLIAATENAKWDLNMYQYGTQVLASIGGTATSQGTQQRGSSLGGALSGALSGAAAGAMIGAPTGVGAPIGAVVGGAIGLASAFM